MLNPQIASHNCQKLPPSNPNIYTSRLLLSVEVTISIGQQENDLQGSIPPLTRALVRADSMS